MRFISDIISEKRRAAPVDTSYQERHDAGAPIVDPFRSETWGESKERPADPLPLDAYALAGQDRVEDAEQDTDEAVFNQIDAEIMALAPDQSDAQETEFLHALQQDDLNADENEVIGAEIAEDEMSEPDTFGLNDLRALSDPFERLTKDRMTPGVTVSDPVSMDDDGTADPDIGLVVVGRATQADITAQASVNEPISVAVPAPALGRGSIRSGRVKTRLLGFSTGSLEQTNVFDETRSVAGNPFPVGWLVVVSELGRGASFALRDGVSKVGRGTDQTVCLNFGDNSISRDNHLSIAYDSEQNKFYIGHSGKSNLVRLNNKPLLSTEELVSRDQIRLGETTLRFIALCENDFTWHEPDDKARKHA